MLLDGGLVNGGTEPTPGPSKGGELALLDEGLLGSARASPSRGGQVVMLRARRFPARMTTWQLPVVMLRCAWARRSGRFVLDTWFATR
jgi:hypothetical protein